jgi:hypothetical protein
MAVFPTVFGFILKMKFRGLSPQLSGPRAWLINEPARGPHDDGQPKRGGTTCTNDSSSDQIGQGVHLCVGEDGLNSFNEFPEGSPVS